MGRAFFAMSVAAISLSTIGTSAQAAVINYACSDGATIRVDTKAQTVVVDGDNQPSVQINNVYIAYGGFIRINRKSGAVENLENGQWAQTETCRVAK
jgi:hypothetical protein